MAPISRVSAISFKLVSIESESFFQVSRALSSSPLLLTSLSSPASFLAESAASSDFSPTSDSLRFKYLLNHRG